MGEFERVLGMVKLEEGEEERVRRNLGKIRNLGEKGKEAFFNDNSIFLEGEGKEMIVKYSF